MSDHPSKDRDLSEARRIREQKLQVKREIVLRNHRLGLYLRDILKAAKCAEPFARETLAAHGMEPRVESPNLRRTRGAR